jgi:site-specific DNA recombinase
MPSRRCTSSRRLVAALPAEQARIIQLLVRRVTVTAAGLEVDIRREGIAGVIREMVAPREMEAAE